jgi:hypothetical protein
MVEGKRITLDPNRGFLMLMKKIIGHLLVPSLAPALLVGLYFTPKYVFGCANRGLMALAVVFIALVAAIITACKGISQKRQGNSRVASWWMISTLILLSPLFLLVGPLG